MNFLSDIGNGISELASGVSELGKGASDTVNDTVSSAGKALSDAVPEKTQIGFFKVQWKQDGEGKNRVHDNTTMSV